MKVLVTGDKGFFGTWLVPALKKEGHIIKGYDKLDGFEINDGYKLGRHLVGMDACIHLAGIPHYDKDIPTQEYIRVNVDGTKNVAWACWNAKVKKLIFTSSGAIYGFALGNKGFVKNLPITEDDFPEEVLMKQNEAKYGLSKILAEKTLEDYQKKVQITVLRINVIEPNQSEKDAHDGWTQYKNKVHFGWHCSQNLAIRAYLAALNRPMNKQMMVVNVGEKNDNLDPRELRKLLEWS